MTDTPRHNARNAARQLQRAHPSLKHIDAYAACSPDATAWRTFCEFRPTAELFQCAGMCGQATELLLHAATNCLDARDQTTLVDASTWAMLLTLRLNELFTYAGAVEVSTPFVPPGLPPLQPAPSLNPLSSSDGLGEVAVVFEYVGRSAKALITCAPAPHEVQEVAHQLTALERWIFAPGAPSSTS